MSGGLNAERYWRIDTIGVFRNGLFMLRNSNSTGPAEAVFGLGIAGDIPISGDWNGNGVGTVGIFRPSNGALYLKNQNSTGFADLALTDGLPNSRAGLVSCESQKF